jgi:FkbM family methyltransferase
MKHFVKIIFRLLGQVISLLIKNKSLFRLYNYIFEHSPHVFVRFFVKYVNLPLKNNIWKISLVNGKSILTKILIEDSKTSEFALSYQWHSPSLNFTENLLNEYYPLEIPWIDVGSNLGIRSLLSLSENRLVYFVEPNPEVNKLNTDRCLLNGFENFTLFEVGASDQTGTIEFTIDKTSYNSSINSDLVQPDLVDHKEIIQIETLDNLFSGIAGNYKTACIKIDVEGHELNVLDGAKEIVSKYSPTFIIEVNQKGQHFSKFIQYFSELNYQIFEIGEFESGRYYKRIKTNHEYIDSEIQFNDFFAIKDIELLKVVEKYIVF